MEKRDEFLKELQALLEKYDVEIVAGDHWTGYSECGEDFRMTAEFRDWQIEDVDLGAWVDKQSHGGQGEDR
jgi:IS1 family transposase